MLYYLISCVLILILIGFFYFTYLRRETSKKLNDINHYTTNFTTLYNAYQHSNKISKKNEKIYINLISDANYIQQLLGSKGFVNYQAPFQNILHRNLEVVPNFIPYLMEPEYKEYELKFLHNTLLMSIGDYTRDISNLNKSIKNPILLLINGVKCIISIPTYLLYSTGLISYETKLKYQNSLFNRVLNFAVILIGLVSSIITLADGWDKISHFSQRIFNLF